jgi:hypothetical protein
MLLYGTLLPFIASEPLSSCTHHSASAPSENFDINTACRVSWLMWGLAGSMLQDTKALTNLLGTRSWQSEFGEFGARLAKAVDPVLKVDDAYHHIFGPDVGTHGAFRSAELAQSLLQRWKSMTSYELAWPADAGSIGLRAALELVRGILSRCAVDQRCTRPNFDSEHWASLMAATAGWYSRWSISLSRNQMSYAWVMAIHRALELSLQAVAFRQGFADFIPNNGRLASAKGKPIGVGELVSMVDNNEISLRAGDKAHWVSNARHILEMRNRSRLGHGILCPGGELFDDVYAALRECIAQLYDEDLLGLYKNVMEAFTAPDITRNLRETMLESIGDRLLLMG